MDEKFRESIINELSLRRKYKGEVKTLVNQIRVLEDEIGHLNEALKNLNEAMNGYKKLYQNEADANSRRPQ